ncbi:MAG: Fe-S cluster assembly protein SufB, partial [Anaerolineales bacterium]|nr:Fe-S cluster assembly protein SufB [Anaerolineales bacterium]
MPDTQLLEELGQDKFDFKDPENYFFKSQKGLNREIVIEISHMKDEPEWMLAYRLKAYDHFVNRPMPTWGPDVAKLDLDDIYYYIKPTEGQEKDWDDVPDDIKNTFDKLGIPEAEQKFLSGVGAQYESEMVYHSILEHLEKQGVIFLSIEDGLRQHPDLFREYFGTVIPYQDNKFAALNSAVWSGGSFVYIPKGVKVDLPLQAYFRLNVANIGQFERSLIIADEGAQVHYVEGCTAPTYSTDALHSGVIEIIVKRGARVRYSTIQNWSTNVYNLVTQRAKVYANATMEWVDSNLGSKVTMKYPSCYLMESGAHGEILSMAFAGNDQIQDAGGKMIHFAPHTSSKITS